MCSAQMYGHVRDTHNVYRPDKGYHTTDRPRARGYHTGIRYMLRSAVLAESVKKNQNDVQPQQAGGNTI